MSRYAKWAVGLLVATPLVVVGGGFLLLSIVLGDHGDCFDQVAVRRLADERIEEVVPVGAMLRFRPSSPTCGGFERRYQDPSRDWVLVVRDPERADAVIAEIGAAARAEGWSDPRSDREPVESAGTLELTKEIDGQDALLVMTTSVVDDLAADEDAPAGSVMVWVTTSLPPR